MLTSWVSSSAKITPVSGDRMPAEHGAHADERPETGALGGEEPGFDTPERPADHQQRREHASRRSGAERYRPDDRLDDQHAEDETAGDVALEQVADDGVAHAKRLRKHPPPDTDHQPADRRPPHPMNGQPLKGILCGVDGFCQQR